MPLGPACILASAQGAKAAELTYDPEDERTLPSKRPLKLKGTSTAEDHGLDLATATAEQMPPNDAVFARPQGGAKPEAQADGALLVPMERLVCGVAVQFDVRVRLAPRPNNNAKWRLEALQSKMRFKRQK